MDMRDECLGLHAQDRDIASLEVATLMVTRLRHQVDRCNVLVLPLADTTFRHCSLRFDDEVDDLKLQNCWQIAHGHTMTPDIHPKVEEPNRHVDGGANCVLHVGESAETVDDDRKLEVVGPVVVSEVVDALHHPRARPVLRQLRHGLDTSQKCPLIVIEVDVLTTQHHREAR